jgi:hypothetical protein
MVMSTKLSMDQLQRLITVYSRKHYTKGLTQRELRRYADVIAEYNYRNAS